jgi:hypothetical protein
MATYQVYVHGRVLVAWIKATSHQEAAKLFFAGDKTAKFCSVGRKSTAPEKFFSRDSA